MKVYFSIALVVLFASRVVAGDPLPAWSDGAAKRSIIEFVQSVTDTSSANYVSPSERVATFDNDGCLWSEQPVYFQFMFAIDWVRENAAQHPDWASTEPFASACQGDIKGVLAGGKESLAKILSVSHANMTADEFRTSVVGWLATAKHPTTGKPYDEMVFQPMLELLAYLRENDFKTFIVSGGGIDFLRVFAEQTYGIPPEQVVGSSLGAKFELRNGVPTIIKTDGDLFVDDKEGKPVGIYQHIGRRPILAAGNSDGDLQMLQYTTIPRDPNDKQSRLGLIVHHTDDRREWAYDRQSMVGKLDQALDQATERGWIVVDMKRDWNTVYPQSAAK